MNTRVKQTIIDHALSSPDEEVCGLVYHTERDVVAYPCANVAPDGPTEDFQIDPQAYAAAASLGKVCGVYHSHRAAGSGAVFSEADLDMAVELGLPWYLYAVGPRQWAAYVPPTYHVNPVGQPFIFGCFDCLEAVRVHYRQTLGIHLTDHDRDETFRTSQPNAILDGIAAEGFINVGDDPLVMQPHDVLLFHTRSRRYPHHLGVYMGCNRMLHHPADGLSRIDDLSPAWFRELVGVLRHASRMPALAV